MLRLVDAATRSIDPLDEYVAAAHIARVRARALMGVRRGPQTARV